MTHQTTYEVKCSCGHIGRIIRSESDSPYSKPWEEYSLLDLNGKGNYHVNGFALLKDVFSELKPTCPSCGKPLTHHDHT